MKRTSVPVVATFALGAFALATATLGGGIGSSSVDVPNVFASGTPAIAAEVNQNFETLRIAINSNGAGLGVLQSQIDALPRPSNVIQVAASGGDFSSVNAALASITDSAIDNPYLVAVAPGEYVESDLVSVASHVRIRGAGQGITTIRVDRSGVGNNASAAAVELADAAAISNLTVVNGGNGSTHSIGVFVANGNRTTLIQDVTIVVDGSNLASSDQIALSLQESEIALRDSVLMASGSPGGGQNRALVVRATPGSQKMSLVENSRLEGIGSGSNIGSAVSVENSDLELMGCVLFATTRGIVAGSDSSVQVRNCKLMTEDPSGGAVPPGIDTSTGGVVNCASTQFQTGDATGTGTARYVGCYTGGFCPIVNGNGSSVDFCP